MISLDKRFNPRNALFLNQLDPHDLDTINSFAAATSSFHSSFAGCDSEEDIISSSRSRASVLVALRARHFASVVAYSFFGIFAIAVCTDNNFSALVISSCFSGSRLISVSILSVGVDRFARGEEEYVFTRD
jgi:hypothetical protein